MLTLNFQTRTSQHNYGGSGKEGGGGGNEEGRGGEGRGRLERANLREGEGRERGGCIAYYRMCAINVHAWDAAESISGL